MQIWHRVFLLFLGILLILSILLLKRVSYFSRLPYSRISLAVMTTVLFFLSIFLKENFGQFHIDKLISLSYLSLSGIDAMLNTWLRKLFLCVVIYSFVGSISLLFFDNYLKNLQIMNRALPSFFYRHYLKLAFISMLAILFYQSQAMDYVYYQLLRLLPQQHDRFKENFRDPRTMRFQVYHPKSLILIYVESLEKSYMNPTYFKKNLLASLSQQEGGQRFENFYQMPGADWSLGGLIASQCGLPVRIMGQTILDRNLFGTHRKTILPGAWCLSDILASHHYHNVYMNGASLKFAGFDHFLLSHHYHEIYGRQELKRRVPQTDLSEWGLPDDALFIEAKKKLEELVQLHRPFNLTLFTIDTHGVEGHINRSCQRRGAKDFPGIVECSANLVANFIHDVQAQPWSKDVLIVVMGDHLAMKNKVSEVLEQIEPRYIFNLLLNSELSKNRDEIYHVDWLPTILTGLGFQFPGNQLGLGYSALGIYQELPLHRQEMLKQIYLSFSPSYDVLWSG